MEYIPPMDMPCKYGEASICTDPECVSCNIKRKDVSMSPEAEADLKELREESDLRLKTKYIKGNLEHGGDLMSMSLVELILEALDENTDQRVYLLKALKELKK